MKQVRQFVGMASYYRAFVPNFAALVAPLTALTKKNALVVWTEETEEAVRQVVERLVTAPVLQLRRDEWEARVTTDASVVGMGGVFEQQDPTTGAWRPCAFWSRQLNRAQQAYSPTNREWLAVVEAVARVWRHWLQGRRFIVCTDHAPLRELLVKSNNEHTSLQQRWFVALSAFDFSIQIIRGKHNVVADALSRTPQFVTAAISISAETPRVSLRLLQAAAKLDGEYQKRVSEAEQEGVVTAEGA